MPAVSVTTLDLRNKKVLVRCDFNVPLEGAQITDPTRIDASLPTIRYILDQGAAAVLCSHLGRPKSRTPELSLKPVAEYLSVALGQKVILAPDCIGDTSGRMITDLAMGSAILLENLRFHPEEEANDRDFAHELARGKQVYVNDAFGTAHRAHASTVGVTRFLSERAAGLLMIRELEALRAVTENPAHPYVAILGGAKVSDKIGVIRNLMNKADAILIGGAMAYTFLKARGARVGLSRVEEDKLDLARELLAEAAKRNVALVLPIDHVVAATPEAGAAAETVSDIPSDRMGLDIGPRTVADFAAHLAGAKTVIWNGPLGLFEIPAYAHGTMAVGEAIANLEGVTSVIGGGDTAAAVAGAPWATRFTHISTGGGATLEYLEGIELPGVKALDV
ncbi:MAG TPA: phosphoglycerate kinase [Candidatus Binataceae bacterium]|jgi:phosphoglycerate kinase|nr:phosphoglycerate kinase [Candidatus Binataceae bacterium]